MVHFTIVPLKTLTLALGAAITYFSYRAYRRTGAPSLRALTVGFGVVTTGALVAGALDLTNQFAGIPAVSSRIALAVESLFTAVGFAVILYSLYSE
jgi:hypothetical protein